ncbi:conserved unknown protein [Ectocarpus siliculosus]|uniref:NECAP PHear domain-containing protein n=1 Tax=Ectocarpus siliculosus TaxID=2880 RepID=D8LGE9_ECTSI|nr:conserved unknown protein [Ectocarpus siliculosus]|eukprot:CBN75724.1 conserved unknown protein [Ectocarpus siliculosus]
MAEDPKSAPDAQSSNSSSSAAAEHADGEENKEQQEQNKEQEQQQEEEEEEEELVIEQPLLTIKEVFVYRVPPLRASSGHRAEEWGLANPVFTGVLKIAQVGNACCLRLFKPPPEGELGATPELFAQCEVRLDGGRTLQVYVESVIDSSRYFVLRCEDKASGRHAYVGVGFRERSSAFDFKAVLDDFVRFLDRQKRAEETSAIEEEEGEEALGPVKLMKDLSIAEGQKLHIGLKDNSSSDNNNAAAKRDTGDSSGNNATRRGGVGCGPPPRLGGGGGGGGGGSGRGGGWGRLWRRW